MGFDLTYLSFGAGLQSTALLVMSVLRFKGVPKIDVAIFADTKGEPAWVYEHLKFMRGWVFDHHTHIEVVSVGDLAQDVIDRHAPQQRRRRFAAVPCWTEGKSKRTGLAEAVPLKRQCTQEYKIEVIERYVKEVLFGYKRRARVRKKALCLVGISMDEAWRMKDSRTPWIVKEHPLVDLGITRVGCADLLDKLKIPVPRKSACVFCPYHDDAYWQDLKDNFPEEWNRAVAYDAAFRNMTQSGVRNPVFLHRSLQPLPLVEFKPETKEGVRGLFDGGFLNECEGMCGV